MIELVGESAEESLNRWVIDWLSEIAISFCE